MARYIDAELIRYERHEKRGLGIDYGVEEESYHEVAYKKNIDKIPTADVIEVKHGHWVPWWTLGFETYKCSVCGYHNTAKAIKSGTENYCCNCGAKMDEE